MQRLEVSGAVQPIYVSLGVKRLRNSRWLGITGEQFFVCYVGTSALVCVCVCVCVCEAERY